jgi:hypothetical protein
VLEDVLKLFLDRPFQAATPIVAVLALGLSVWTFYLQRVDKRARLRVRAKDTWRMLGTEAVEKTYAFEVANVGHVPVTVAMLYLRPGHRWKDKYAMPGNYEGPRLPVRLQPGESATWNVKRYPVEQRLRQAGPEKKSIRATIIAEDGLGKFHKKRERFYLKPSLRAKLQRAWIRVRGDA